MNEFWKIYNNKMEKYQNRKIKKIKIIKSIIFVII